MANESSAREVLAETLRDAGLTQVKADANDMFMTMRPLKSDDCRRGLKIDAQHALTAMEQYAALKVAKAVADEREACARVASAYAEASSQQRRLTDDNDDVGEWYWSGQCQAGIKIASVIRARARAAITAASETI